MPYKFKVSPDEGAFGFWSFCQKPILIALIFVIFFIIHYSVGVDFIQTSDPDKLCVCCIGVLVICSMEVI